MKNIFKDFISYMKFKINNLILNMFKTQIEEYKQHLKDTYLHDLEDYKQKLEASYLQDIEELKIGNELLKSELESVKEEQELILTKLEPELRELMNSYNEGLGKDDKD